MARRFASRHLLSRCRSFAFGAALVMGAVAFAAPSETVLNEWCPVMTDEKIDPAITVEYRGKTIAFCCDMCVKKFQTNPAKYESRLPQFAKAENATDHGQNGEPRHDHSGADGYDHSDTGHSDTGSGDDREPFLGRLHPIIIHFPIAGLPLALLGFLVWAQTGREAFSRSDAIPLFVATLASIASVITGNIAHDSMRFSESLHVVVERHELVSTVVMVVAICLSLIRLWRWNRLTGHWRWVYGGGLVIACALLGYTGFLGGSLVFGPDHLSW